MYHSRYPGNRDNKKLVVYLYKLSLSISSKARVTSFESFKSRLVSQEERFPDHKVECRTAYLTLLLHEAGHPAYGFYQCVTVWEIWVASVIWWQHWNQFLKSSTSIKKIFCMYMIYRTWMKLTISFSFGNFVRKTKPTLRLVLKQSQNNSPWHIHSLLLYTFGESDCWKGLHKKLCI